MDGNLRMCRDLVAWPARRMAQVGLCYRTGQPTRMAFLRLLSSPVGTVLISCWYTYSCDSGRAEFPDKARSGLKKTVRSWAGPPYRLAPHAQQKGGGPLNDDGNKLELLFGLSRYLSTYVLRAYAEDLDVFAHTSLPFV